MFDSSYGLFQSGQEFYNFLDKLIEKKKRKIENSLGVEIEKIHTHLEKILGT